MGPLFDWEAPPCGQLQATLTLRTPLDLLWDAAQEVAKQAELAVSGKKLLKGGPCFFCNTTLSCQWRRPEPCKEAMCNSCGIKYRREVDKRKAVFEVEQRMRECGEYDEDAVAAAAAAAAPSRNVKRSRLMPYQALAAAAAKAAARSPSHGGDASGSDLTSCDTTEDMQMQRCHSAPAEANGQEATIPRATAPRGRSHVQQLLQHGRYQRRASSLPRPAVDDAHSDDNSHGCGVGSGGIVHHASNLGRPPRSRLPSAFAAAAARAALPTNSSSPSSSPPRYEPDAYHTAALPQCSTRGPRIASDGHLSAPDSLPLDTAGPPTSSPTDLAHFVLRHNCALAAAEVAAAVVEHSSRSAGSSMAYESRKRNVAQFSEASPQSSRLADAATYRNLQDMLLRVAGLSPDAATQLLMAATANASVRSGNSATGVVSDASPGDQLPQQNLNLTRMMALLGVAQSAPGGEVSSSGSHAGSPPRPQQASSSARRSHSSSNSQATAFAPLVGGMLPMGYGCGAVAAERSGRQIAL